MEDLRPSRSAAQTEPRTGPVDALDAPAAGATAIRGSALRSGGYALGVLLSLLSAPLLIRHLGLRGYGAFATIMALVTIVTGLSELGLTSLGVREWAQRDAEGRVELMHDLLGARIAFALIGSGAAMGFALAAGYDAQRLVGTAVACSAVIVQGVQSALTVPLAGGLRQGRIAAAELVRQAVQVCAIVALVAAGAGLVPLLATAIPAALASLWLTALNAREGLVMPALHPRHWSGLLKGTLPFVAAAAVNVVYFRLAMIITSLIGTASVVGEFAIAFRVVEVLIAVPALLIAALFPLLARAALVDPSRLRATLDRTWRAALGIGGLVAVVVVACAPIAVLVLSGQRPGGAVDALRVLGAGLGFSFVGATGLYGLLAARAHRAVLVVNVTALILNAALTSLLVPAHGAVGGAIALASSELALAIGSTVLLRRATGAPALDLGVLARTTIVVAVGAGAIAVLAPAGDLLAALVAPAMAIATAAAIGALPSDLVLALVPRRRPGSGAS
jgi:O-antigen/teichoic acid export membrane protein